MVRSTSLYFHGRVLLYHLGECTACQKRISSNTFINLKNRALKYVNEGNFEKFGIMIQTHSWIFLKWTIVSTLLSIHEIIAAYSF